MERRKLSSLALGLLGGPTLAHAASPAEIDLAVHHALARLRDMPVLAPLLERSHAVLVFPQVISGGLLVGAEYGEGALIRQGVTAGHYSLAGVSVGLLAGAQTAGLAMFFMTEAALARLLAAGGWEFGTDPSVVVLDRGAQANITTTSLREEAYAITFGQEGLMAAVALTGSKITRLNRPPG